MLTPGTGREGKTSQAASSSASVHNKAIPPPLLIPLLSSSLPLGRMGASQDQEGNWSLCPEASCQLKAAGETRCHRVYAVPEETGQSGEPRHRWQSALQTVPGLRGGGWGQQTPGRVAVRASLLPGAGALSCGLLGGGAGRGALHPSILELSHSCPLGPGLPGPSAAGAAHQATGPHVRAARGAGVVVAVSTAADDS